MASNRPRPLIRSATLAKQRRWFAARQAEQAYQRALGSVARHVGRLIVDMAPGGVLTQQQARQLEGMLQRYGATLQPWAAAVTRRMQAEVAVRDAKAWHQAASEIGLTLRQQIATAPVEQQLRLLLDQQIQLITSIPLRQAERAHRLAVENLVTGERASVIQDMLLRSGTVAVGQAKTIARTETSRTASLLTQTRAMHVGSPGYIWRTSHDTDVRPSHKKLDGQFFTWDRPPLCDAPDIHAHPGAVFNCRCYPEVVLPPIK